MDSLIRNNHHLLRGFPFREDDLVHHEEDHHGHAAIEHRGSNVVDPVGHELARNSNPDAVDRIDDHRHNAEGNHIPHALIPDVTLAEMQVLFRVYSGFLQDSGVKGFVFVNDVKVLTTFLTTT